MLRTHSTAAQLDIFDPFLPEEIKVLPEELGVVDEFLDDERFFEPYRTYFDPSWGRPSVPVETYLRMMYLKFRWGLGYETLSRRFGIRSPGGGSAGSGWVSRCRIRPPWSRSPGGWEPRRSKS